MTNIIDIQNFDLDIIDSDGTSHWIVTATVADMVQVRPATYHPADSAPCFMLGVFPDRSRSITTTNQWYSL
jgi:hypothetical protein